MFVTQNSSKFLTPSFVLIKLFPALNIIKLSRHSTFSILLILLPKTFKISKLLRPSKFSRISIELNVRFNSFNFVSDSRFSILSILLNANERIFKFGRIQRWSIFSMSVRKIEKKKKNGCMMKNDCVKLKERNEWSLQIATVTDWFSIERLKTLRRSCISRDVSMQTIFSVLNNGSRVVRLVSIATGGTLP